MSCHVQLKRCRPVNNVNPWFNKAIKRAIRKRDICYVVWKSRKSDGDRARPRLVRRRVTRLIRNAKRSYMATFLNLSLPTGIFWKNMKDLDSGPIMFSPDELNTFYSSDVVGDLPNSNTACHLQINQITLSYALFHFVMSKKLFGQ
jgi:hypothetical protein